MSNPEIADRMGFAVGTIKNILTAIFDKVGLSDREQLAIFAVKKGLVETEFQKKPTKKLNSSNQSVT